MKINIDFLARVKAAINVSSLFHCLEAADLKTRLRVKTETTMKMYELNELTYCNV